MLAMIRGVNACEISARCLPCAGGSEKMNQFFGAGTVELNVSLSASARLTFS